MSLSGEVDYYPLQRRFGNIVVYFKNVLLFFSNDVTLISWKVAVKFPVLTEHIMQAGWIQHTACFKYSYSQPNGFWRYWAHRWTDEKWKLLLIYFSTIQTCCHLNTLLFTATFQSFRTVNVWCLFEYQTSTLFDNRLKCVSSTENLKSPKLVFNWVNSNYQILSQILDILDHI